MEKKVGGVTKLHHHSSKVVHLSCLFTSFNSSWPAQVSPLLGSHQSVLPVSGGKHFDPAGRFCSQSVSSQVTRLQQMAMKKQSSGECNYCTRVMLMPMKSIYTALFYDNISKCYRLKKGQNSENQYNLNFITVRRKSSQQKAFLNKNIFKWRLCL